MIIATVSSLNYLYKAEVLAKSVKEQHPEAKVFVCLVEREMHPDAQKVPFFDEIILAKDLGVPNFEQYIFKYDVAEAAWALKSQLLKYLLVNEKKHNEIIYLDSDIMLYSPLNELLAKLKKYPIVLTPHDIQKGPKGVYLYNGIFNAGFIGLNSSHAAKEFIDWWAKKTTRYCYRDRRLRLYDDQGWLKLVPTFFETYILRHPGYNIAFWNLQERIIGLSNLMEYTVNDHYPLRFFHHSQHSSKLKEAVKKEKNKILLDLYLRYTDELEQAKLFHLSNKNWSYNFFSDGSLIKKTSRRNYLKNAHLQKQDNPFTLSNQKPTKF